MRVLVTGFEPFGGETENAAAEAIHRLAAGWSRPGRLHPAVLPVSFTGAPVVLRELVARYRPDGILAVGEAGGRTAITPETRARNRMDARIADNLGDQPRHRPIDDGPEWLDLPFDASAAVAAMREAGVPSEVSTDAGTFVCNRVAREVAVLGIAGGFVHVPAVRSRGRAAVGWETDESAVRWETDKSAVGWETDESAVAAQCELSVDDLALALERCLQVLIDGAAVDESNHR